MTTAIAQAALHGAGCLQPRRDPGRGARGQRAARSGIPPSASVVFGLLGREGAMSLGGERIDASRRYGWRWV